MAIPAYSRFWILLAPLIPSILVTIFVLYHLLKNRGYRTALNNHVIILLLSVGLVEEITGIVWNIYFFRNGTSLLPTPAFCYAWIYIDTTAIVSVYILVTWASIERHILIFHSGHFSTRTKRLLFHYLPMILCILYPMIFYFVFFFIIPCNLPLRYTSRQCGRYSCVSLSPMVALYDSLAHYILPAFITVTFSGGLFVRVLYQKYHIHQRIDWRNYKKMALQLLPISCLYIFLQLPPMSLYAAYSVGLPRTIGSDYFNDSLFFSFYIVLLTPFACAMSLPELRTKCRNLTLFWRRIHAVDPMQTVTVARIKVGRMGGQATINV
ncbi:unnamed protein product [Adineta steineri]|uniref:Uncharacterized protein n=1 Tax=Adineta steineri TaxID=433720 RepID=A0A815A0S2_9BILA|nr:unnamed protein product [Adineta steineri]CAF1536756.1 unnamed protein product [Adineta steineri]